jgi:hypothetical protein
MKRARCRFRQKGTWVVDCEQFKEDRQRVLRDWATESMGRGKPVGLSNAD